MNTGAVWSAALNLLCLYLSLSRVGVTVPRQAVHMCLARLMRIWWKESRWAFRCYNLSEESWLALGCLWVRGEGPFLLWLCVLINYCCGEEVDLEGKRDGRGDEAEMELQSEPSLSLGWPCSSLLGPCRAAPALFLCFLSPSDIFLFGHLSD